MIIIETCPKCGHDLMDEMICTNPPIPKKKCTNPKCGWTWEGQREQVLRVPFIENETPYATMDSFLNTPCITCANNPKNGGSGNCNCTLGQPQITC